MSKSLNGAGMRHLIKLVDSKSLPFIGQRPRCQISIEFRFLLFGGFLLEFPFQLFFDRERLFWRFKASSSKREELISTTEQACVGRASLLVAKLHGFVALVVWSFLHFFCLLDLFNLPNALGLLQSPQALFDMAASQRQYCSIDAEVWRNCSDVLGFW